MEFFKSDGARTGLFFGATSGVITTIGLIVGLNSGTRSITAVLGGILIIAVADAMSFLTKFIFSISFAVPLLLLPLGPAVTASVIWGLVVIVVLSYFLAKSQDEPPLNIIGEHVGIAVLVLVFSHYIGVWVAMTFG